MQLDPSAERFLDMLSRSRRATEGGRSLEAYRAGYASLCAFAAKPDSDPCVAFDVILHGDGSSPAVRIYDPSPDAPSPTPLVAWIHGGGWIAGGYSTCDALCRILAKSARCKIAAIDYRLAPEHPFPAGLDDCATALHELWRRAAEFGSSPDKFAVAADSAGAHLAAGAIPYALDAGAKLRFLFLLCPVIDPFGRWPSRDRFARGYLLEEEALSDYIALYGRDLDPADPRVSPLRSRRLSDFPPTIVHTAEFDPVRDEGEALAAALSAAGVSVRHTRHLGMIHNFYSLTGVIPSARRILADIGDTLGLALQQ